MVSEMIPLGTRAPSFRLPVSNPRVDDRGTDTRSLDDYADAKAVVVVFTCNHCPYVHAVEDRLIDLARTSSERGVPFIAISSNDPIQYPEDGFERMTERAEEKSYPFPYLFDASQAVARAYSAACTPDFYLFDADRMLVYRGRLDDGRPGREATTRDLAEAIDELLSTGAVTGDQMASMGCGIKWKN